MFCGTGIILWDIFHIQHGWKNIPHNIVSPTDTIMDLNNVMVVNLRLESKCEYPCT